MGTDHVLGRFRARALITLLVVACAAAVTLSSVGEVAVGAPASMKAASPKALSASRQEAGMRSGAPLREPSDLNLATPHHLRLRLVAKPTWFDIGGKRIRGLSYDGRYVGPTMHFVPGEYVRLKLVNKLSTPTNLHFHGLHISPRGHGDNPAISVPPGKSFVYRFHVPRDQVLGTFWYHDHDMCMGVEAMSMSRGPMSRGSMSGRPTSGSSAPMQGNSHCADVESQIYDGLSGSIIVGDDRNLLPRDLRHITAHTLVFKDMQVTKSDHIVRNSTSYAIDSDNPTVRLVNGQLRPVLTMRPGQTELWRLSNEGADIFYRLRLDGYRFTVIGQDGYPAAKVVTRGSLCLPPAKRWDVLVTAGPHPGTTWLRTLKMNTGPGGDSYPEARLMKLRVAGQPVHRAPMPTGRIPTSARSLAHAPIARRRTLRLSASPSGDVMYINGKTFNPSESIFAKPALLGTVEQWTVLNETDEIHPFHVHTDQFQVMSVNGRPQPDIGQQDVVPIPYEKHGVPGRVVLRIDFADFIGKVMFHCHIAAHEDAGMMSYVNVVRRRFGG